MIVDCSQLCVIFRLVQIESNGRQQQHKCDRKIEICVRQGRKHRGKG